MPKSRIPTMPIYGATEDTRNNEVSARTHDLGSGWHAEHRIVGGAESLYIFHATTSAYILLDGLEVRALRKIFREAPGVLVNLGCVLPERLPMSPEARDKGRRTRANRSRY
jgi:hypothetical protein